MAEKVRADLSRNWAKNGINYEPKIGMGHKKRPTKAKKKLGLTNGPKMSHMGQPIFLSIFFFWIQQSRQQSNKRC